LEEEKACLKKPLMREALANLKASVYKKQINEVIHSILAKARGQLETYKLHSKQRVMINTPITSHHRYYPKFAQK